MIRLLDCRCSRIGLALGVTLAWGLSSPLVHANPIGGTVSQGSASFSSQGSQLTVQTSDRAFINWQSFNIGVGQTTTFVQPSSSSLVWNQISDPNPSQILGTLNANGYVVLQNQAGFYIGGQAVLNTHGLLMTTAPTPAPDLAGGGPWQFNAPPPSASIINYGQINVAGGGSAFLIAHEVENHGAISAPQGNIGLYAGKQVLVSARPDGRGLSAQVTLPAGSVDNTGRLVADAGVIAMQAQVVNQGGLVEANSIRQVNGVIELIASDAVNLGANSVLSARGDSQGASPGGTVTIKSGNTFSDQPGSTINVSGGAQGGNGGQIEISAPAMSAILSQVDGRAANGFLGGKLTIDPQDILLTSPGDPAPASGTVNASDPPSQGTLTLDVASFDNLISQGSLSQVNLQATRNIEVATLWSLPDSQTPRSTLTLAAGRNITLDDYSGIGAGKNWTVNLTAGTELSSAASRMSGQDGIYLLGSAHIQTQNGDINLWAANEVQVATTPDYDVVGNGVRTLGGGNINVTALYGDVNSGGNTAGFVFNNSASYYSVSPILGGISTAAGGNVTITAGGDVHSYLPIANDSSAASDGGTGAFGPEPGDVTITAGGSVYGHYVVANGAGTISAGQNAGAPSASQNIALSLIKGSWDVNAPNGNIYLQEVRNPNGIFNNESGRRGLAPGYHLFDYDPFSSVDLNAGIGVYLTGQSLPRPDGGPATAIYPPTLTITAGLGGVVMSDDVTLFASPYGELHITTTGGGNFANDPNSGNPDPQLTMSDSPSRQWTSSSSFGVTDRGSTPIELNNPNPVVIQVSGNMENINLTTTKQTRITVGGDMDNCGFSGQNLHPSDVTSIDVAGQIFNRSSYSFVFLPQAIPNLPAADLPTGTAASWDLVFSLALNPNRIPLASAIPANIPPVEWASYILQQAALFPSNPGFSGNPGFVYDPTTRRLGFSGQMSPTVLAGLIGSSGQTITVLRYGADGLPIVDSTGHFVIDQVSWANPQSLQSLYTASQGAPSAATPETGLQIGGPGRFEVSAGSMSLGNSYGILSRGVDAQYAYLAPLTAAGASVDVTVTGNLEMLTSTIAALGGGDVNVISVAGSMDLGSQDLFGSATRAPGFGIFTSGRGNVNVVAQGDINVDGSRIATYDGGNVSVESLQRNVNAGSGGTAYINLFLSYVDPATGKPGTYEEAVTGSGILATTLVSPSKVPGSALAPGNITVQTPRGDIEANMGGILQEALNGNVAAGPTVTLAAGTRPSATSPGYAGNIDLGDSGVIGGSVNVSANGNVNGLVISRQNTIINAAQSFSGTVLSGGTANLTAGGTVSGTIAAVGGISASGGQGVTAALLSQTVSVGGVTTQGGLASTAAATTASQSAVKAADDQTEKSTAMTTDNASDDEMKKRGAKAPVLVRKTSRVTVILPPG